MIERISRRRRAGSEDPAQAVNGYAHPAPATAAAYNSGSTNGAGAAHDVAFAHDDLAPTTEMSAVSPAHAGDTDIRAADPQAAPETPAAQPQATDEAQTTPELPDFRERGRLRRRTRYLRRLREIQLRDIGGLVVELHRFERERPDLVAAKVAVASDTAGELRGLERALEERQSIRELREPGIGGACVHCGAVHGGSDRYCASCGEPLTRFEEVAEGVVQETLGEDRPAEAVQPADPTPPAVGTVHPDQAA